jgi:hypothetical protein
LHAPANRDFNSCKKATAAGVLIYVKSKNSFRHCKDGDVWSKEFEGDELRGIEEGDEHKGIKGGS